MGLLGDLFRSGRLRDPVAGTARVVSCSTYSTRGAVYARCRMQLVVEAPGMPARALEREELVHRDRWPSPGAVLPVKVDRADPSRVKIEWDEVQPGRERARQTAEGLAAALRGEGGAPPSASPFGGASVEVVNLSGGDLSQLSDEQRAKLQALGVDVDALSGLAGAAAAAAAATPGQPGASPADAEVDDDLARLEKLAELRDRGILTEAEFEAQKRRILEG